MDKKNNKGKLGKVSYRESKSRKAWRIVGKTILSAGLAVGVIIPALHWSGNLGTSEGSGSGASAPNRPEPEPPKDDTPPVLPPERLEKNLKVKFLLKTPKGK